MEGFFAGQIQSSAPNSAAHTSKWRKVVSFSDHCGRHSELFKPIWLELPATADILLNLMKNFFVWATTVEKARSSNLVNPAEWQYLKPLLPSKKLRRERGTLSVSGKGSVAAVFCCTPQA